jgi:UDP:flavonoid glycosyltransferase YjiC (YdhE family)
VRILCTSLPADDLGLPSRLLPVAGELRERGHEIAFCNPAPAPSRLIASAGFGNLPIGPPVAPKIVVERTSPIIDSDHLFSIVGYCDPDFTANDIENWKQVIRDWRTDLVLDSFGVGACTAARILNVPQVQILQGDLHPDNRFTWWLPSASAPSPVEVFNQLLADAGLPPVDRAARLCLGTASAVVGCPSTDPVPDPTLPHVGALSWGDPHAALPASIPPAGNRPLVYLYCGNPTYRAGGGSNVVLDSAIEALGDADLDVIVGAGNQTLLASLPANFVAVEYAPGQALARRADVMIHHGGHGSTLTTLAAGTPALIIPTFSERESSARRVAALGAGRCLVPEGPGLGAHHVNTQSVDDAVHALVTTTSYRQAAQAVQHELAALPGSRGVADTVEAHSA